MNSRRLRIRDHLRKEGRLESTSATAGKAVACIVALIVFLYLLRTMLLPFVLAGIAAFICHYVVEWLRPRLPLSRTVIAVIVLVAALVLAAVVGWLAVPPLLSEGKQIVGNLPALLKSIAHKFIGDQTLQAFGGSVNAQQVADKAVAGVRRWFSQERHILMVAVYSFTGLFGFILTLVVFAFFLLDSGRIAHGLFWLVPPRYRPFAARVWDELEPILGRYFVGIALVVIYASVAAYVGLGLFLGLKHAVLLSLMTGFLEVIPLVGPAASAIIAGFVAVQEAAGTGAIIAYVLYAAALRISIDQFFGPLVLGRAGRIPPVLVMFCFLAGGLLFGMVGVILAVPTALTIRTVLHVLYDESRLEDEGDARHDDESVV